MAGIDVEGDAEGRATLARFSNLAREALAAGRSGSKWKSLESLVADLLGVDAGDVGAAGTHDFRSEFTRLRGQAPASASVLGLVFIGKPADYHVAEERITESIRSQEWRPTAPIGICADLGEGYRIQSVVGSGAEAVLERLEFIADGGARAREAANSASSASPLTLAAAMRQVLDLQADYASTNTEPMRQRGLLVRGQIPDILSGWLSDDAWAVEGRDATGKKSKVPWVRVYDETLSPSARTGWYVVYLFAFDGSGVALSLNQGTTEGSKMKSMGTELVAERVGAARQVLASQLEARPGLIEDFDLADGGGLADGYQAASVAAICYPRDNIPADTDLRADLELMLEMLRELHVADEGQERGDAVWIFQANPAMYDLRADLKDSHVGDAGTWTLRQHKNAVAVGDTVLLWSSGRDAGIYASGRITGEPYLAPRHEWEDESAPDETLVVPYELDRILETPVLRSVLREDPVLATLSVIRAPQGTNYEVTSDQWEALRPMIDSAAPAQGEPSELADATKDFDWLVEQTLWTREDLQEIVHTLSSRRPQVVLAGPPGTGKTWVAESLATHLTGGRAGSVWVVQFHPSYSYEDFVEGLRPVPTDSGSIAFDVVEGVLVEAADHARAVDHPVVLVIDEMNRGNVPSVFGELLYLLEYRGKSIRLLHRPRFSLPPNLYVIGTMNTADRSIRSIDAALRRRFDIFECAPSAEILESYYASSQRRNTVPSLAQGLLSLNERLAEYLDRHHGIGHTFFMQKDFNPRELERTWLRQVKPLIEEYFFDQPDIAEGFTLETLWPE